MTVINLDDRTAAAFEKLLADYNLDRDNLILYIGRECIRRGAFRVLREVRTNQTIRNEIGYVEGDAADSVSIDDL